MSKKQQQLSKSDLLALSFSFVAVLGAVFTSSVASSYAQSSQSSEKVCPTGFELSKGRCEAPAVSTSDQYTCEGIENQLPAGSELVSSNLNGQLCDIEYIDGKTGLFSGTTLDAILVPGEKTCSNSNAELNGNTCTLKPSGKNGA